MKSAGCGLQIVETCLIMDFVIKTFLEAVYKRYLEVLGGTFGF